MLRADAAPAPASQVRTMRPARSWSTSLERASARSAGTLQRKRTSPELGLGRGSANANRVTPGGAGTPVVVTAYRAAEGIATATTDAQGDALVPFSASASGEIWLKAGQPRPRAHVTTV